MDAELIAALGAVRLEVSREMDRVQAGLPVPEGDPLSRAVTDLMVLRINRLLVSGT